MLNGELIKETVKKLGLSDEAFAVKIEASIGTVHNLYNGKSVRAETLSNVARILGFTMEQLLKAEPEQTDKKAG